MTDPLRLLLPLISGSVSQGNLLLCEIAGAVAEAALKDLRVNLFRFSGFPQIHISELRNDVFIVTMTWLGKKESFNLTYAEAKQAVKKFKGKEYDSVIFDRVQEAIAKLE